MQKGLQLCMLFCFKDEGARVSGEFDGCTCVHPSPRTPDAMQRGGTGEG